MSFIVEQSCPQCAAPIEFQETDHLILCQYCGVKNFLVSKMLHLFMPPKQMSEDFVFVPYLRFKGVVYCLSDSGVNFRVADLTSRGVPIKTLPISLGIRPQAVKLHIFKNEYGKSLQNFTTIKQAAETVGAQMRIKNKGINHLAIIGETISLIFLPISIKNRQVLDAVSNAKIGTLPAGQDIFASIYDQGPGWQPEFIATLCPECGWNLDGQGDSVVLTCWHCDTAWRAGKNGFKRVKLQVVKGKESDLYLPFWKIEVQFPQLGITDFADFADLTGQTGLKSDGRKDHPLYIWTPAFKIRPKIYLNLARQLSMKQNEFDLQDRLPVNLHPVTLPLQEAAESLIVVLTHCAVNHNEFIPLIKGLKIIIKSSSLTLLPFQDSFHDLRMKEIGLSVNKKSLQFGRQL